MVGGQRPPLPHGEALRRRHLWKPEAFPPARRSPEALYRSYSLYIPLSMPLFFWPCLSFSFALPETNVSNTADLYHYGWRPEDVVFLYVQFASLSQLLTITCK